MIVGASASSDAEILATASDLYARHDLRRVYYSAFSPFSHAPASLPETPIPRMREHRLYQADFLIRRYGFDATELTTASDPHLSLTMSPKLTWALRHPEVFPIDLNTADRELLLRVPGIGYRTVDKLLRIRRHHRVRFADLVALRVRLAEARHFVITEDSQPIALAPERFFSAPVQQQLAW